MHIPPPEYRELPIVDTFSQRSRSSERVQTEALYKAVSSVSACPFSRLAAGACSCSGNTSAVTSSRCPHTASAM
ncbi:hypothetical protein CesoFtcFv8_008215 [Champsocephalus esox]|uniref:Uncharacterized protein n=1 Tax=Champsocephalus esox TaxID=159716 RepID=A0AAN8H3W3_9TELE|nr:hypothetical protein CesoFtcFv8_008215 [Champsocephalus esox]